MPTYCYACPNDHAVKEVRRIADCDEPMPCPTCGLQAERAMHLEGAPAVHVFKGYYNPSLGKYIGSQGDVRDACNRIESETGSRPVEIGNEKPKHKPAVQEYDYGAAVRDASMMENYRA